MSIRKSEELAVIYLARHGETAWSRTGRRTGGADLPLTEQGERNSALGYKDSPSQPAIRLWNETHYLLAPNEQESDANNSATMEEP
jgi:Histidine phosphatase superfamily (branch 1)